MKCFVAGTLILTIEGLKRIEDIRIGDRVLSIDIDTMKSEYKDVLETFVRKTEDLIHIFIGEEEIITTVDHPFWVKGKGFVPATCLVIGSELINDKGDIVYVENIFREKNNDGVEVYNFKVEDYHTYYVGENCILVHNANYKTRVPKQGVIKETNNSDGTTTYTKVIDGKEVSVTYSAEGYPDFSPYAHPDHPKPVKINMTGDNSTDFKNANLAIGRTGSKPPKGYTWHHMEDGESMILVRRDVHDCTTGGFAHTGGASVVKNK